jgi:urease accessory protein
MIRERLPDPAPAGSDLVLPFELREKHRLLTRLASGEPVGLALPRGTVLRDGDCLRAEDGQVIRVVAASEALLEVRSDDPLLLARVAYHLGNRHTRVQLCEGALRFADDTVLARMVETLGASAMPLQAAFEPEAGAYAGAHTHSEGNAGAPRGVIHDMIERTRSHS